MEFQKMNEEEQYKFLEMAQTILEKNKADDERDAMMCKKILEEFGITGDVLEECLKKVQPVVLDNIESSVRKAIVQQHIRELKGAMVLLDDIIAKNNALNEKLASEYRKSQAERYKEKMSANVEEIVCAELRKTLLNTKEPEPGVLAEAENVMSKMEEIREVYEKIDATRNEIQDIQKSLKFYKNLPDNIFEAEVELQNLKKKYKIMVDKLLRKT